MGGAPNPSGRIKLENDAIVYELRNQDAWRLPIPDVRVVGEYTTSARGDDYFFVFATKNTDWFVASFYAEGRDETFAELGRRLHHELQPGLCNSADLKSRTLWPARLEGHPLFDFAPAPSPANILSKLWRRVSPRVCFRFTDEVQREICGQSNASQFQRLF